MRKDSKHNTKESHQTTREERKKIIKEYIETTKTENNEQNGNKYIPINNYFKCK